MPERYLGRTVGRFRIDSVVGSGGFAWVYRGYDPELDIPVAIKVLKPQFAGDQTFETRFRAEASIAAKLRHPHIIRILAVGREGDAVYSVMDFLPHGLADRLRDMTALPEPLVARIGMHVADALAFAHREGVIHRDIKPDNILFDEHGNAIVADFGIACAASGIVGVTGANMVVGTPQYFSPEQARGLPLDGRADVYSLGVTLYRCATGVLPFDGDDWYEIARQHVEDRPRRPRSLAPGLSADMERVILRCLAKDPAERWPSADVLRQALAALAAAALDPARTPTVELLPISAAGQWPRQASARRARTIRRAALAAGAVLSATAAVAAIRDARGHRMPGSVVVPESSFGANVASAVAPHDSGGADPVPGGGVGTDSEPPDSTTDARSAAGLRIDAPRGAQLRINGIAVGTGPWASDTMPPGRYDVTASLPAIDGCEAARQERRVVLAAGQVERVSLRPVRCGELALVTEPANAVYVLTARENGQRVSSSSGSGGRARLVLPEGWYALRVAAPPPCLAYEDSLRIGAGTSARKRVALICK